MKIAILEKEGLELISAPAEYDVYDNTVNAEIHRFMRAGQAQNKYLQTSYGFNSNETPAVVDHGINKASFRVSNWELQANAIIYIRRIDSWTSNGAINTYTDLASITLTTSNKVYVSAELDLTMNEGDQFCVYVEGTTSPQPYDLFMVLRLWKEYTVTNG